MTSTEFEAALSGLPTRMVRCDGGEIALDIGRWHGPASGQDGWLLDRCHGPALDLGCGPGRLVAALIARGIPALGIDLSTAALAGCRERRVPALCRDLFAPLPAEGDWAHVLLVDGNIGIGGDPRRLLRRAAQLLRPGGTVLVETDPRPDLHWSGTVALQSGAEVGAPLPWATLGAEALRRPAAAAGLVLTDRHDGERSFVELAGA